MLQVYNEFYHAFYNLYAFKNDIYQNVDVEAEEKKLRYLQVKLNDLIHSIDEADRNKRLGAS